MTEPLALYVHWPFCLSKCPYCDFNSHVRERVEQDRWRDALMRQLDCFAAETEGRRVTSVFFGGGTPSLMAPSTVASRASFSFSAGPSTIKHRPNSPNPKGVSAAKANTLRCRALPSDEECLWINGLRG